MIERQHRMVAEIGIVAQEISQDFFDKARELCLFGNSRH